MARTVEEFRNALSEVDAETTRLGVVLEEALAKIKAGGMTAEQEEEVFGLVGNVVTRMKAIAKDPDNPVPNPTPE